MRVEIRIGRRTAGHLVLDHVHRRESVRVVRIRVAGVPTYV